MFRFSVHDIKGNPLAGVKITATAKRTGQVKICHTNSAGNAEARFIPWSILADVRVEIPEGYECVYCHAPNLDVAVIGKFVLKEGISPIPPTPAECQGLGFTETVRCVQIGDYQYAAGWTASKGIGAAKYPYVIPSPWEADPNKDNIYGTVGSHGGCSSCAMTLVHLRKYVGGVVPPEPPEPIPGDHCYTAAGELVMKHGEEKCVSGDLYICLDGVLSVSERDPDCKEVENGKAACPIACVCMGTPLIDALGPVREFRDFVLKKSWLGRCFISFYYTQVGPFLSLTLVRSETLRKAGRWVVRRILGRLEK